MTKRRIKIKLPTVTSRHEAEYIVGEIAQATLNQIRLSAKMDKGIATVRQRYEGNLAEMAEFLKLRTETLRAWAEANPDQFPKGRKSLDLVQGIIGFRTGTPKLALLSRAWNWEKVLAAVQSLLPNFVRNKPEIDKESIIAQRDEEVIQLAIKGCGMKIVSDESFFVEPRITEVETRQAVEAA